MDHGWWWHLMHDPMRHNPWSLLMLVLLAAALFGRAGLMLADRRLRRARGGQHPGPAIERPERPMAAPETPPPSGGKRWIT